MSMIDLQTSSSSSFSSHFSASEKEEPVNLDPEQLEEMRGPAKKATEYSLIGCLGASPIGGATAAIGTFFAVYGIFRAIFAERRDLLVKKEDELACRALMIGIGIVEITWIGGVLTHGIASIYFAWSRSSQEQA